jgi:hypothetical protein
MRWSWGGSHPQGGADRHRWPTLPVAARQQVVGPVQAAVGVGTTRKRSQREEAKRYYPTNGVPLRTIDNGTLPNTLAGSVCAQSVKCGRPNCRCARGQLHGPYYYRFFRERGKLRKRYVRKAEVEEVRTRCQARRNAPWWQHSQLSATIKLCRTMEKRLQALMQP